MTTRFSATAAAIGLVGGVLAVSADTAAGAAAVTTAAAARPLVFSVADADTASRPVVTAAAGNVSGGPAGIWPAGRSLIVGVPAAWSTATASTAGTSAPAPATPANPSAPSALPTEQPTPRHATPKQDRKPPAKAKLPFHMTGKKARGLPDTGLPMSAALGAVTALTALLAGIGTVLAARRRSDHEA